MSATERTPVRLRVGVVLMFLLLAAACADSGTGSTTTTTAPTIEGAESALVEFLSAMSQGRYPEAAELFAGPYEALIEWNPTVDRSDRAALLEAACTHQLSCGLRVREMVGSVAAAPFVMEFEYEGGRQGWARLGLPTFIFVTELEDEAGELVTRYNPADDQTHSTFTFTVVWLDGRYKVLDLPLYLG